MSRRTSFRKTSFRPWILLGICLGCLSCGPRAPIENSSSAGETESRPLLERRELDGLDFEHVSGAVGRLYTHEQIGSGAALADLDGDGDLDLYLVQGAWLGLENGRTVVSTGPDGESPPSDRVFRNDLLPLSDEEGAAVRFVDVTLGSGIEAGIEYGMGIATGDVDNDGRIDLYVTAFGPNRLWLNRTDPGSGDFRFEEAAETAGVGEDRWSTAASFFDFDGDGWLDLYVVNYVDYRLASHQGCVNKIGASDYCGPESYEPESDRLWRNLGVDAQGQVRFEDLSAEVGLLAAPGPGLGVVAEDFDEDGLLDLYVANDGARNQLWLQRRGAGRIRLVDEALRRGCALDEKGRTQASMGVVAFDFDRDSDLDLFMTHLENEVNTLYVNEGQGQFFDRSTMAGVARPSLGLTGFGVADADFDGDGWSDLALANGAVRVIESQREEVSLALRQRDQLLLNRGGRFVEATDQAPDLAEERVSRAAVVGDIDNDGDPDLLVTHGDQAVGLYETRSPEGHAWIGLRLVDRGRDALGARAALETPGEGTWMQRVRTDGSYLSARDSRILFALPDPTTRPGGRVTIIVDWRSGAKERYSGLEIDRYHELRRGEGEAGS